MQLYTLVHKTPVRARSAGERGLWFSKANRVVRRDTATIKVGGKSVGQVIVSTVFLGCDYGIGTEPLLFESLIIGGPYDGDIDRCATWEGAEKMHEKMMERVLRVAR
jgi:hypothetical protein